MAGCVCYTHHQIGDIVGDFGGGAKKEKKGSWARKRRRRVGGREGGMMGRKVGLKVLEKRRKRNFCQSKSLFFHLR